MTIRPDALNQTAAWQRTGHDIEIKVESEILPAKAIVRVCVAWQINKTLSQTKDEIFLESHVARIEKFEANNTAKGLRVVATIPELGDIPDRFATSDKNNIVGIYGPNNAYPLVRVRTLVYDEKNTLILAKNTDFGVISGNTYCDYPFPSTTAGSGIVVMNERKNWQPAGGEIEFGVKLTRNISMPPDALVKVCFRWMLSRGDNPGPFRESDSTRIVERNADNLKIAAKVPALPDQPPRFAERDLSQTDQMRQGRYAIPYVAVPLADVRVLIFDTNGFPIADVPNSIGIPSYGFAAVMVLAVLALAGIALWLSGRNRLSTMGKADPLLRLITSRNGNASLSQFQIILWTFVVAASTVYVFALSGELIQITNGTLILLGISGTSGVISKIKSEKDATAPLTALTPAAAAAEAEAAKARVALALDVLRKAAADSDAEADAQAAVQEAQAKLTAAQLSAEATEASANASKARLDIMTATDKDAAKAAADEADKMAAEKSKAAAIAVAQATVLTRARHPRWSDLVMEESQGKEIDVARVQMLYFTIITAVFVLIRVATSFAIPDIPEGFMILMGISNSVYVGSKFATNPTAAK